MQGRDGSIVLTGRMIGREIQIGYDVCTYGRENGKEGGILTR